MKLADIKQKFEEYIVIRDERIIEMVLVSLVGNLLIERDPVWLMVVAPSSGGKTTLLMPASGIQQVHFIDDLTEKTLLSGYKVKGKEMSLLKTIGSGILGFSDFTNILSKNPISRGEVLSQMKMVYDGNFTKRTGTGSIEWKGKMGFLGASTPDIYTYLESGRSMGERFIYYWMEQPTDDEIINKQQTVSMSSRDICDIMKELYAEYMHDIDAYVNKHGVPDLKMTDAQRYAVRRAAIFCVNGKATVHTDFKSGKPDSIPNKAGVGRDAKMFDTVLQTLQLMNCYEHGVIDLPVQDWMVEVVEKCAYSSINRERRKIIEVLVEHSDGGAMTASEIGAREGIGLERESVEKYLTPMHAVGIVKKQTSGQKFKWYIDDEHTIDFIKRVSQRVVDNTPAAAIEVVEKKTIEEEWEEYTKPEKDEEAV